MLPPVFGVLFDGIAYGMLLFVLSVGLSVTLGLMNFVNLAHCAFAMLGGYVIDHAGQRFSLAIPGDPAFGVPGRRDRQRRRSSVRSTDGSIAPATSIRCCSPSALRSFPSPLRLTSSAPPSNRSKRRPCCAAPSSVFGLDLGKYRLFLVGVALVVTMLLVAGLEYTRFGAQVRAAVDNQRMARGLGIDVDRTFASTFALGSGLAGLGGALAVEIVGLDPNFAFTYLVYVLIIVSVGGLGSIAGSFAAAILIGVSDVAGKYYAPELGAFLIYLVMVVVLMWRPAGLFGRR